MDQLLFLPGPVAVDARVLAAMATPMVDHRGAAFAALLGRIGSKMQPIFGTAGDVVVLGASGTGGLEAAVSSMFAPGEKVLACPVGVFGKRIIAIAQAFGIDVEVLDTPWGQGVDAGALAARLKADVNREIMGILLTHNETSTGVQNDMQALAGAIAGHPAYTIVDSVSGLGASHFAMDAWRFDVVVTASQKALAVPPGLAMVAVSSRAWEKMAHTPSHKFYFDLVKAREFAALGQTPWTPPISIAFALDAALDLYEREGAGAVYARHATFASAYRAAAQALGLQLYSKEPFHSVTVAAISLPDGIDGAALLRHARDEHGIVLSGGQQALKGKIVRIGTMGAISPHDVVRAVGALESALHAQSFAFTAEAGTRAATAALATVRV